MKAPYYDDGAVTLYQGNSLKLLRTLPDNSVDSIVTDPPYGLGFMGKKWDSPDALMKGQLAKGTEQRGAFAYGGTHDRGYADHDGAKFGKWCLAWTTECLRVLKPGGHMIAFGGTRTWHRLACAAEDAGFEIRDSLAWLYGSGFPKSLDVSKAIDKALGAERAVVGTVKGAASSNTESLGTFAPEYEATEPATIEAQRWDGWGTALKPAFEPMILARKPFAGTVASNVLTHGTAALNIDGCRIETTDSLGGGAETGTKPNQKGDEGWTRPWMADEDAREAHAGRVRANVAKAESLGRWPANVLLDESQAAELDQQSGTLTSGTMRSGTERQPRAGGTIYGADARNFVPADTYGDSGGASRFFYVAKADASERVKVDGVAHPTVKPLDLMRWLVRLITPPGGVVLEPFAGSGTTVEACILEGFMVIAMEREKAYLPLIVQRIHRRLDPVAAVAAAGEDVGLFALLDEVPA